MKQKNDGYLHETNVGVVILQDMRAWLLVLSVTLASLRPLPAQFYSNFGLQVIQERVLLSWTLSAGSTCQGTFIERSSDGSAFDTIGVIAGVCGDPFSAITYDFVDSMPLINQRSWYRLTFGNTGESNVLSAEVIRLQSNGVQILRFPNDQQVYLYFANPANQVFTIRLFTINGQLVWESTTFNNKVAIPASIAAQRLLYELLADNSRYASGWVW